MNPLNYCRQLKKQLNVALFKMSVTDPSYQDMVKVEELVSKSQKFMLPEGGVWYDDPDLRALDITQKLRLPFPVIALEYACPHDSCNKVILLAEEVDDVIAINTVAYSTEKQSWGGYSEIELPTEGYIIRHEDDSLQIRIGHFNDNSSYLRSAHILLSFLNVLSCKNVTTYKTNSLKKNKGTKDSLKFDTYHVLTVETNSAPSASNGISREGRSPREHLRRGHIRCYQDGKRVWVNATVVNAGKGGRIIKDYVAA